jgi:hypothetical protein
MSSAFPVSAGFSTLAVSLWVTVIDRSVSGFVSLLDSQSLSVVKRLSRPFVDPFNGTDAVTETTQQSHSGNPEQRMSRAGSDLSGNHRGKRTTEADGQESSELFFVCHDGILASCWRSQEVF